MIESVDSLALINLEKQLQQDYNQKEISRIAPLVPKI